jgi:hypothetical protein
MPQLLGTEQHLDKLRQRHIQKNRSLFEEFQQLRGQARDAI